MLYNVTLMRFLSILSEVVPGSAAKTRADHPSVPHNMSFNYHLITAITVLIIIQAVITVVTMNNNDERITCDPRKKK